VHFHYTTGSPRPPPAARRARPRARRAAPRRADGSRRSAPDGARPRALVPLSACQGRLRAAPPALPRAAPRDGSASAGTSQLLYSRSFLLSLSLSLSRLISLFLSLLISLFLSLPLSPSSHAPLRQAPSPPAISRAVISLSDPWRAGRRGAGVLLLEADLRVVRPGPPCSHTCSPHVLLVNKTYGPRQSESCLVSSRHMQINKTYGPRQSESCLVSSRQMQNRHTRCLSGTSKTTRGSAAPTARSSACRFAARVIPRDPDARPPVLTGHVSSLLPY